MLKNWLFIFLALSLWAACSKETPEEPEVPLPPSNAENCQILDKSLSSIPYEPVNYDLPQPVGFPQMEIPADNPLTVDGVELGRRLFFDPILSADGTQSCSSCHFQNSAFTDNQAVSRGIDGIAGTRSSMSLTNLGYNFNGLFWDGRVSTLEAQALLPVEDPIELHHSWVDVVCDLTNHPDYPTYFRKAFGIDNTNQITKELAAKAMAQFERSLVSYNSKFDRVIYRQEEFFSDDELNGYEMFFDLASGILPDAECGHCHNAPLFTVNNYRNNGLDEALDLATDFEDNGFGNVTGNVFDNGKFRIPTLRNIALTAPYMHDGRFQTLEEVIDHYDSGGHYADNLDPLIFPIGLTEEQKGQILSFLHTLTDTTSLAGEQFSDPFE
ncbi:MAG: cytochrome c peroxidase [Bacteroidota bacterium]